MKIYVPVRPKMHVSNEHFGRKSVRRKNLPKNTKKRFAAKKFSAPHFGSGGRGEQKISKNFEFPPKITYTRIPFRGRERSYTPPLKSEKSTTDLWSRWDFWTKAANGILVPKMKVKTARALLPATHDSTLQ